MSKSRAPAVEGWFTLDPEQPRLLGTQCQSCQSYFFPRETAFCRNPACSGTDLVEVPLSGRGRLWSYTVNHYAPPPPYVAPEPFEPYAIAAVELDEEKMVVLGQVAPDVDLDQLEAGVEMELALGTLYEDDENEYVVWKWQPVPA